MSLFSSVPATCRKPLLTALLLALPLCAVETKSWLQNTQADFEKGTLRGVSLRSDGRLTVAPVLRELYDPSTTYLWVLAQDSRGKLYLGGGGSGTANARLFAIEANGKGAVAAEVEGLEIHAIAINRKDEVFFATSPDSKVYRLRQGGKAELFYDPKAKYVWGMAFGPQGELYIATGDQGEVHRVQPDGKGSVWASTDETHARSLAVDAAGNVLVGTEPGGLLLRISPAGQPFVLHQMNRREVTAIVVGSDQSIYAAAVGTKSGPSTAPTPAIIPITPTAAQAAQAAQPVPGQMQPSMRAGTPAPSTLVVGTGGVPGGSEVVRISRDGAPEALWTSTQEVVYSLALDREGRPILGTGNRGLVLRLDSNLLRTTLVDTTPTQVTGLLNGAGGKLYAVTGNIGKLYQIGPELEKQGVFESDVLDAGQFTTWGRIALKGTTSDQVLAETRSGNLDRPQRTWSPWAAAPANGRAASPAARFLQYRLTLQAKDANSPEVIQVESAYLPKNVAPRLQVVETTPANYRFPTPSTSLLGPPARTLSLPPVGQGAARPAPSTDIDGNTIILTYAKGSLGVRWAASDDNGDDLLYTVEMRGVKETEYRPLAAAMRQRHLTVDTTAFPDGEYVVRVNATDAPSNAEGQALTSSLESDQFVLDNTPPAIAGLTGTRSGTSLTVRWKATDALSNVVKAEYSLNGSEWTLAEPETKLSDARELDYRLTVPAGTSREPIVAIRVTDEFDNQRVEKTVVR